MQLSNPGKGTLDDMREANITLLGKSFLLNFYGFFCSLTASQHMYVEYVYATILSQKDQSKRHGITRSFFVHSR